MNAGTLILPFPLGKFSFYLNDNIAVSCQMCWLLATASAAVCRDALGAHRKAVCCRLPVKHE